MMDEYEDDLAGYFLAWNNLEKYWHDKRELDDGEESSLENGLMEALL